MNYRNSMLHHLVQGVYGIALEMYLSLIKSIIAE